MKNNQQPRRTFLKNAFSAGFTVAGLAALTAGCTNTAKDESADSAATTDALDAGTTSSVDDCADFSQVSEAELEKRKALGYEEVTPFTDKQCDNCQLFIPAKEGKNCGGCMLFKGPVFDNAHCTYWAPQTDA